MCKIVVGVISSYLVYYDIYLETLKITKELAILELINIHSKQYCSM